MGVSTLVRLLRHYTALNLLSVGSQVKCISSFYNRYAGGVGGISPLSNMPGEA